MFLGLSFLVFNLVVALDFRQKGLAQERLNQQQTVHYKISKLLNKNLNSECTLFSDTALQSKIRKELERFDLGMELGIEKVLQINELFFKRIVFQTRQLKNSEENMTTYGYLVEHTGNKKCFGLL